MNSLENEKKNYIDDIVGIVVVIVVDVALYMDLNFNHRYLFIYTNHMTYMNYSINSSSLICHSFLIYVLNFHYSYSYHFYSDPLHTHLYAVDFVIYYQYDLTELFCYVENFHMLNDMPFFSNNHLHNTFLKGFSHVILLMIGPFRLIFDLNRSIFEGMNSIEFYRLTELM